MSSNASLRAGLAAGAFLLAGAMTPAGVVHASGPVERLIQVVTVPQNTSKLIVRYGAASEGLLISEDGKTFRAMCTAALDKAIGRISTATSIYFSPMVVDGAGR